MFKDKNGYYNMREIATAIFLVIVIISWIGEQFFGMQVPEFMFYGFISLIGAGCFGYSIERKQRYNEFEDFNNSNNDQNYMP